MTATMPVKVFVAPNGKAFTIAPDTEVDMTPEEFERQIVEWRDRNGHLLAGASTEKYIAQKRRAVEEGLE